MCINKCLTRKYFYHSWFVGIFKNSDIIKKMQKVHEIHDAKIIQLKIALKLVTCKWEKLYTK